MGTLDELLAHFQEHRAAHPVLGLSTSGSQARIRLHGQRFRPAHLIAQLLDQRAIVPLATDIDEARLGQLVDQARRIHQRSGLSTLWLNLGSVQSIEQDAEATSGNCEAILQIPVVAVQDSNQNWTVQYLGTEIAVHPKLQELGHLPPNQDHRAWWVAFAEALMQDAQLNRADRLDLNCVHITCETRASGQIAQDLAPQRWGDAATLGTHPVLSPLLGPGFLLDQRQGAFTAPYLTGQESPLDHLWIEDADQFQAQAMLAAASGDCVVIQGPCGSGKTQTLTNMVGDLVAQGRKVLLLSQSRKDLQTLEQRLLDAHLGHASLCIYDEQRPDEAVALDLIASLELGEPSSPDRSQSIGRYRELHEQLNRYAAAIRTPLGESGWCYQEVVGRLLAIKRTLQGCGLPKLGFDTIAHWTQDDFQHAKSLVGELVSHIEAHGTIAASPFVDVDLSAVTPENAGEWCDRIAQVAAQAQLLMQSCDSVFTEFDVDPPADLRELGQWVQAFDHLSSRPDLGGFVLDRDLWAAKAASVVELLASARLCQSLKETHQEVLLEAAWEADVLPLRSALRDQGDKWWRRASKRWREARSELQGLIRGELPQEQERVLSLVEAILHYQSEARTTQRLAASVASLFGPHWNGEDSDWEHLERCAEWLTKLLDDTKAAQLPSQLWSVLDIDASALANAGELSQSYANLAEQLQTLTQETGVSLGDQDLESLEQRLVTWSEGQAELTRALDYRSLEGKLRGLGLSTLVTLAQSWSHPLNLMQATVELAYLAGLEALAFAERPQLRDATNAKFEAMRAEFCRLDQELPALAQEQLNAKLHSRRLVADAPPLIALAQALQDPLQRGDLATLLSQHWDAISAQKPVVLATPVTLATKFRDPASTFDTVIIDSAGTMPLCDAIGGILRSKQLVVVGDSRQSPVAPSATPGTKASKDLINPQQSILHRARSQGASEYLLSLHYRSKHDSLVSYVNQVFYEGALKIPPSPCTANEQLGLSWVAPLEASGCEDHVQGVNPSEADQVVQAIVAQLQAHPEQSLGVVTLSQGQAQLIQETLAAKQQAHPELTSLLCPQRAEPFLIQCLQDASREDRSVIFFSLGYGQDSHGAVSANWGALHSSDGHRKLSIALTRARAKLQVFGNIEAQHIVRDEDTPTGLSILSGFLEQAQNCSQRIFESAEPSEDRAFANQVRAAILDLGFSVRSPTAAHEVDADLYVYDPEHPEVALVGILCDTQRYHRQMVARDRERICSSLLYNMGWKLHRVWCRDWLADPEKEKQRLADTLSGLSARVPWAQAQQSAQPEPQSCANPSESGPLPLRAEIRRGPGTKAVQLPFSFYKRSCDQLPVGRLQHIDELAHVDLASAIVVALEVEGEMHVELLTLRLAQRLGLLASSPALKDAVAAAVERTVRSNRIQKNGQFVSLQCQQTLPVRTRAALPLVEKRLTWIPPSELELALVQAAAQGQDASNAQILTGALQALGLLGLGPSSSDQLAKRLTELDSAGKLRPKPATGQAA